MAVNQKKTRLEPRVANQDEVKEWARKRGCDGQLASTQDKPWTWFGCIMSPAMDEKSARAEFLDMVDHPDERFMAYVTFPTNWAGYYGPEAADPYLCWLAEEGWVDPETLPKGDYSIKVLADIWRAACEKMIETQDAEGVVLNFRGICIFNAYHSVATLAAARFSNGDAMSIRLLKDPEEELMPPGPGLDGKYVEFMEWIKDHDESIVEQFSGEEAKFLWPNILGHSKLAGTYEGVKALTGLLEGGPTRWLSMLLINKELDIKNPALVEWAVGKVKEGRWDNEYGQYEGEGAAMFWEQFYEAGGRLNEPLFEEIEGDMQERGVRGPHAWIADVYEREDLRKKISQELTPWARRAGLNYLTGPEWLALAIDIDQEEGIEEDRLSALLQSIEPRHLAGLDRRSLIPLMRSRYKGVRVEMMRLMRMIEAKEGAPSAVTSGESASRAPITPATGRRR